MSETLEYVLFSKRDCCAYSVPPATSSGGFRAAEWGPCVWRGICQLVGKGDILLVKLIGDDGSLFLGCPISNDLPLESCLERTIDSSRYFVLKLTDLKSGRKALMGFGFDERNDAFDFNVAIQDFRSRRRSANDTDSADGPNLFALRSGTRAKVPGSLSGSKTDPTSSLLDFGDFGEFQSSQPFPSKDTPPAGEPTQLDDIFK
jgi:hypothetical protein